MKQRGGRVARCAVRVAIRVVHHDPDDIARIVGGGHAGEGDPVDVVEVAAACRVDLLRRSGLAGNLVTLDRSRRPGALLVAPRVMLHDRAQHVAHGPSSLRRYHPNSFWSWLFGAGAI